MTTRTGSTSIDRTPISDTDLARIEAEDKLHAEQQRSVARVVASSALDVDDARMLMSMLGLTRETIIAARVMSAPVSATATPNTATPSRKSRAAA